MTLNFPCVVTDVFERKLQKHLGGAGKAAVFSSSSIGWYIQIDGAFSLYCGMERPHYQVDDEVYLSIRSRK